MIAKLDNDDDLGMPESPIHPNFSEHLWKARTGRRVRQLPNRSHENMGIARPPHNEPSLPLVNSQSAAEENIEDKVAA